MSAILEGEGVGLGWARVPAAPADRVGFHNGRRDHPGCTVDVLWR